MKKNLLLIILLYGAIALNAFAQTPNYLWAKRAGGTSYDDDGNSVSTDANGNVFMTGQFASPTLTFGTTTLTNAGGGHTDMFLVKYDASGNVLWAKSAGGINYDDNGNSVSTDANGNVFVTGFFNSPSITFGTTTLTNAGSGKPDMFLVKYDASGNVLWAKSAGGTNDDIGHGISTDANGNVFVTGEFGSDAITFGTTTLTNAGGAGPSDIFIVKYNALGDVLWAKSSGGTHDDNGLSVSTDANGNAYITGAFKSTSITFGTTTLTNADNTGNTKDVFLAKYDASGTVLWAKSAGGTSDEESLGVSTDISGNVLMTGRFESSSITFGITTLTNAGAAGTNDLFLAKYDNSGNVLWAKRAGGTSDEAGGSVSTDANGNMFVTGIFSSSSLTFGTTTLTNAGSFDVFLVKYDASGNVIWATSAGGTGQDWCLSGSTYANGNVFTAGSFTSPSIAFGTTTLTNADNTGNTKDIFVAKLNDSGQYCNGLTTLTSATGSFTDGSGTNNYGDNSDCQWLIQPTGAATITLSFSAFDTEPTFDKVSVYDGSTTAAPLLGTFSGNSIPSNVTSTGGSMLVRFTSDFITNATGWAASYTSSDICTGTATLTSASGSFTDGTGNYNNNADCKWLIQPGASSITLSFSSFNTEATNDVVTVYDGSTITDPVLGTFSGTSIPSNVISTGGTMLVRFTSNGSVVAAGFVASYTSVAYCTGTTNLTSASGSFTDGSGANNYSNNSDCKWLIQPAGACSITLSFSAFDIEDIWDVVTVYDGSTTSASVLATFTGNTIPSSITSGGTMLVRFTSDNSNTATGWSASYTSTTTCTCTGTTTLTSATGSFTDGSGSNNYNNSIDCKWLIQPAGMGSVILSFSSFSTEATNDVVTVYDGSTITDPVLGTFSGTSIPSNVTSTGGTMLVRFTSNGSVVAAGFAASYTSVAYCTGTTNLTSASGSFTDGSGANNYSNNSDCKWLIQPAGACSITLSFSAFDIEDIWDVVTVYDGSTTSATVLATFTGNTIPSSITSGGTMLVRFTSDNSGTATGWSASYTSATTCSCTGTTTLTSATGAFTDGSGSNNYNNSIDCRWLIQPAGMGSVNLSFSSFNTESTNDVVTVYDGSTTAAPVLGTFSGSSIPSSIASTGSSMLVRFTTNASTTSTGWTASYTSTYCGTTTLTSSSGSFSDGSGPNNYSDNSDCKWLIQPSGASSITLSFSSFSIEDGWDYVEVYDGSTTSATLLGSFTGYSIPSNVTSTGGSMLVRFTSDETATSTGWAASYTSGVITVVDKTDSGSNDIELFPNPTSSFVTLKVKDNANNDLSYRLYNSSGTLLLEKKLDGNETTIQMESFASATYILKIVQASSSPVKELKTFKLIKN